MEYLARKFRQEDYDNYDEYAKIVFSEYLKKLGHTILSIEEDYNHDLITKKDGEVFYFELEVKKNFAFRDKKSYPHKEVSFLGRKKRLHNIKEFFYVIICKETEWALFSHSSIIFKDEYLKDVYIKSGPRKGKDQFYRIPIKKCRFIQL